MRDGARAALLHRQARLGASRPRSRLVRRLRRFSKRTESLQAETVRPAACRNSLRVPNPARKLPSSRATSANPAAFYTIVIRQFVRAQLVLRAELKGPSGAELARNQHSRPRRVPAAMSSHSRPSMTRARTCGSKRVRGSHRICCDFDMQSEGRSIHLCVFHGQGLLLGSEHVTDVHIQPLARCPGTARLNECRFDLLAAVSD